LFYEKVGEASTDLNSFCSAVRRRPTNVHSWKSPWTFWSMAIKSFITWEIHANLQVYITSFWACLEILFN
jgi:hypothetical protein